MLEKSKKEDFSRGDRSLLSLLAMPLVATQLFTAGCSKSNEDPKDSLTEPPQKQNLIVTNIALTSRANLPAAYKRDRSDPDLARWDSYIETDPNRRSDYYNHLVENYTTSAAVPKSLSGVSQFKFSDQFNDDIAASFLKGGQEDLSKLEILIGGVIEAVRGKEFQGANSIFELADRITQDALSESKYQQLLIETLKQTNCVANSLTYAASIATILSITEQRATAKMYYIVGGSLDYPNSPGVGHATIMFGEGVNYIDPSISKDGKRSTLHTTNSPWYFYPIVAAPFTISVSNLQLSIKRDQLEVWSVPSSFRK